MSEAIILTESQAWERYKTGNTTEVKIARESIQQGFEIAIIKSEYFSKLQANTPFLIDFSIDVIKNKIKKNIGEIRLIDVKMLSENMLIIAYKSC